MINLKQKSIDYRDLNFNDFLSNLQGNILKGHGRDNTVHIFLKFMPGKTDEVKTFLKNFAEEHLTCFKEQLRQREVYKRNKTKGGLFSGLYVTAKFYEFMALPINAFVDPSFRSGMKNASISDPPVSSWEEGYRDNIHAMILVADDDPIVLGKACKEISDELSEVADIIDLEYGSAIRNANGDGLEHFGYVDGISQPLFLKDEVEKYNNENLQPLHFDPAAELDLVLVDDPYSNKEDAFGSYFVFRKLEQNVRGFKEAEEGVAEALGLTGEDGERVGAMIVGRFEDGTPVTLSNEDKMISSGIMNNFDYKEKFGGLDDGQGARCPFHSHIRKANPRRDNLDKAHIMARRGITYGHRNVSTTIEQSFVQMPKSGVGLLFMSFQKSIVSQFEFIQKTWSNAVGFPIPNTGIDPITGLGQPSSIGKYPKNWNDKTSMRSATFDKFVTLKGGEYFFAPSVAFFKDL